jgi:hypothetical protein
VSGQLHAPAALPPGKGSPGTHWIGGWLGPRAGLDDMEKRKFLTLPGLELRPLGRPARNQSLYRLRYPGSLMAWFLKLLNPIFNILPYDYAGGKIDLQPASIGFLLGLHFDPEDEGDMFLRSVWLSPNYTALQPRRPCSSHFGSTTLPTEDTGHTGS